MSPLYDRMLLVALAITEDFVVYRASVDERLSNVHPVGMRVTCSGRVNVYPSVAADLSTSPPFYGIKDAGV